MSRTLGPEPDPTKATDARPEPLGQDIPVLALSGSAFIGDRNPAEVTAAPPVS
jgi:hypothetical protein